MQMMLPPTAPGQPGGSGLPQQPTVRAPGPPPQPPQMPMLSDNMTLDTARAFIEAAKSQAQLMQNMSHSNQQVRQTRKDCGLSG